MTVASSERARRLRLLIDDVPRGTMRRQDRPFVVFVGVVLAVAGLSLLADAQNRAAEPFLPQLWPWLYLVTGLSTIAYGLSPYHPTLHALTGAMLPCCAVGRAISLAIGLVLRLEEQGWSTDGLAADGSYRTIAGFGIYLLLGRLLHREWTRMGPMRRAGG